ncbi:MAG: T9SS type A sorting domain-containing protein [Sphingobacteriales bacterium]|nr:T9SS type A sorting domain-containing protein [Sphingobacteriales bacterium]
MKTTVLFISTLFTSLLSLAQISPLTPWTWMKGDNTVDNLGIYGSTGVTATTNKPGARTSATTWRDNAGKLWMFGGMGFSNSAQGYLNDLWKYDPASNKWTWMKGDSSIQQFSVYGAQGTAAAANKPGGTYASVSWTDASGNLWLFGGFGYTDNDFGFLNTLWKYNAATNEWTWVKGDKVIDKPGVYGTKGNEHNNNKPGARYGSSTWTDASGNLWLYGGYGYNSSTNGILNDLWRYNPASNKWAWISGDNAVEATGVYGTKGTANPGNKPGARYVSSSWNDADGNFWLFGGYGYDAGSCGNLNDLWKYNPAANQWTWVSGNNTINQLPVYGIQGTANAANTPGARYVSTSWTDTNGELWLFGGYGIDGDGITGYLNDFWKYSPFTNTWTWVKGDTRVDQPGIYGTQCQANVTNKTGARQGSVSWSDQAGNLWLFGGYGYDAGTSGILNDLWKISSYNVVLPLNLLRFSGTLGNGIASLKWLTDQESGFSHFSIQRSFDGIQFRSIGIVSAGGRTGSNEYTYTDTDLQNHPEKNVYYRLLITSTDNKYTYSKVILFSLSQPAGSFRVFPNPATNTVVVTVNQQKAGTASILLTDMNGSTIRRINQSLSAGITHMSMDCSTLAPATYILRVITADGNLLQEKLLILR